MKYVAFIVIAGSSLAFADAASQAQAAALDYCHHYAHEAVDQFQTVNKDAVCAGQVAGLLWHANYEKHLIWCLGAAPRVAASELRGASDLPATLRAGIRLVETFSLEDRT